MQFLQGRHCGDRQLDRRGWRPQHKGCNRNQGNNRDRINSSGASWTSPSPTSLNRTCRDHCPEVSAALTTVGFDQMGTFRTWPRWPTMSASLIGPSGSSVFRLSESRQHAPKFLQRATAMASRGDGGFRRLTDDPREAGLLALRANRLWTERAPPGHQQQARYAITSGCRRYPARRLKALGHNPQEGGPRRTQTKNVSLRFIKRSQRGRTRRTSARGRKARQRSLASRP
jgi:hypothetical protein